MEKKHKNYDVVMEYAQSIVDKNKLANKETIQMCERFFNDLKNEEYEFKPRDAEFVIQIIEKTFVHDKGERLDGTPLRGQPFILEPWQKFIIYNLLGFFHKGTIMRRFKEAFIFLPRKNGKALALDEELPTPNGWKRMKDLVVGDYVYGRDGKGTQITYKSEVFKDHDVYELEFEDGAVVKADANHIWHVMTKDSRRSYNDYIKGKRKTSKYQEGKGYFDITTKEMVHDFVYHRKDGKGDEYKYRVPMNEPVEYPTKNLPVKPYTLGVWLGDGYKKNTEIVCCEEDIKEISHYIEQDGYMTKVYDKKDRTDTIGIDIGVPYKGNGNKNRLREQLREIGVFNNKHIPTEYLQSSVAQRMELLKGLMDTDGTISKNGQCEFTQSDYELTSQVSELLSSLGIKNKITKDYASFEGKKYVRYRIFFYVSQSNNCFKLKRKSDRVKKKLSDRMLNKTIVGIRKIKSIDTQCISVDNEDSLYLVGRKYTVTHNTRFVAALSWALALLERKSGSSIYIVGAALRQARQSFEFINFNLDKMGEADNFRIRDNNQESSIIGDLGDGSLHIEALAANPDKQDSLNCNIAIADELHSYKRATQYNVIKEAMKAYTNKLMIGITTAGDNANSFCYHRLKYCQKILNRSVKDEQYFVFIAKADESEDGEVDYTCAKEHEKANPNYGVTIRPEDIMNDALQAQNDPQQRKDFLAKSINIYTSAMDVYFNVDEFQTSNEKAEKKLRLSRLTLSEKLKKLASLKLDWFGGADLSKRHDLTATAIYANYKGIDIAISHAFFPVVAAHEKANEDNIPLFGWLDDGFLTMSNNPVVDYQEVVKCFMNMRKMIFKL